MIDFVDRDNDRRLGGFGMAQRFERLWHDAVIGGDDQHDDVRHIRAARAHGTESRMAGRIQERDLRQFIFPLGMREGNGVGANVLRDAAGFARGDIGFADDIEQRGLAMVDVTHDGDDRRARLEIFRFVLDIELDLLDRGMNDAAAAFAFFHFKPEAVFGANLLGDRFVNRLVDVRENAQLHQVGDDLERLLLELLGQFANDNGRLDGDDLPVIGPAELGRAGAAGRCARHLFAAPKACPGMLATCRRLEATADIARLSPGRPRKVRPRCTRRRDGAAGSLTEPTFAGAWRRLGAAIE